MQYVYRCADHPKDLQNVSHSMLLDPPILCSVCGQRMKRVPQVFRFYTNPKDVLFDKLDTRYREYRAKKARA